jgi:putative membrane protein
MMKKWIYTLGVAGILCSSTGCATLGIGTDGTPTGTGTGTETQSTKQADQAFVTSAASSGQLEVRLSEVALQKAVTVETRELSRIMVNHHSKANSELQSLARQQGLAYSASLRVEHQAIYDRVSKLTGAAFEKAYATEMEAAHQQDVTLFQGASQGNLNVSLRGYAIKTLPVLQGYLRLATQLKNVLNK